jgi:hypothetical protein
VLLRRAPPATGHVDWQAAEATPVPGGFRPGARNPRLASRLRNGARRARSRAHESSSSSRCPVEPIDGSRSAISVMLNSASRKRRSRGARVRRVRGECKLHIALAFEASPPAPNRGVCGGTDEPCLARCGRPTRSCRPHMPRPSPPTRDSAGEKKNRQTRRRPCPKRESAVNRQKRHEHRRFDPRIHPRKGARMSTTSSGAPACAVKDIRGAPGRAGQGGELRPGALVRQASRTLSEGCRTQALSPPRRESQGLRKRARTVGRVETTNREPCRVHVKIFRDSGGYLSLEDGSLQMSFRTKKQRPEQRCRFRSTMPFANAVEGGKRCARVVSVWSPRSLRRAEGRGCHWSKAP